MDAFSDFTADAGDFVADVVAGPVQVAFAHSLLLAERSHLAVEYAWVSTI
ncbi:hypothetical protein [Nocardia sp. NPDC004604]